MTSLIDRCREMLQQGATIDEVLALMRREGESRVGSAGLLMKLTGMSLREAKPAVHLSSAWSDAREGAEKLHEQAEQAAEQLKKSRSPRE